MLIFECHHYQPDKKTIYNLIISNLIIFLVSFASHLITWRRLGLSPKLQPATRGKFKCFGFSFKDLCGTLESYKSV